MNTDNITISVAAVFVCAVLGCWIYTGIDLYNNPLPPRKAQFSLFYTKDARTNLCFAKEITSRHPAANVRSQSFISITNVPCSPEVEAIARKED